MSTNLRQKDLLIVGFWSDWRYLNEVFSSVLSSLLPGSVTVIDQSDRQQLQQKAPDLWDAMNAAGISFCHIQESGADALDELPYNVVRSGRAGDFIRPEPSAKWYDMDGAREELGI